MLNFLLPVNRQTDSLVGEFVATAIGNTDVPFGILIHTSGPRSDFPCVESAMQIPEVHVVRDRKPQSFANAFCKLLSTTTKKHLVALAHPSVRLDDPKWFGKVQRIFMLDSNAALITTDVNTRSIAAPPSRRLRKAKPYDCMFAIMRNVFPPENFVDMADDALVAGLHTAAFGMGCFVWHHGGVRYSRVECPERLEEPAPSRSRSSTIPS